MGCNQMKVDIFAPNRSKMTFDVPLQNIKIHKIRHFTILMKSSSPHFDMSTSQHLYGKYSKSWPKIWFFKGTRAYLAIPCQTLLFLTIYSTNKAL